MVRRITRGGSHWERRNACHTEERDRARGTRATANRTTRAVPRTYRCGWGGIYSRRLTRPAGIRPACDLFGTQL